jgi:hypothetical protein
MAALGLIKSFSSKPALREKQYRHVRDVCASQGYVAGAAAAGTCVLYGVGSEGLQKAAAETILLYTPFGAAVVAGKALTVGRRVGKCYRLGTMLYNVGMAPFKCANFVAQTPFMALDMVILGQIHVPRLNAKWWSIGNVTDDAETALDWAREKSLK